MRELHHPSRDQLRLDAVLSALGDPVRLEILRQLAQEPERACGTFCLGATKATASHHFKVLREAGITFTRAEGVYRYISLRREDLEARFPGLLDSVLQAVRA